MMAYKMAVTVTSIFLRFLLLFPTPKKLLFSISLKSMLLESLREMQVLIDADSTTVLNYHFGLLSRWPPCKNGKVHV